MKNRLVVPGNGGPPGRVCDPHRKVRKAVFPVGGLGTRFLPITKAVPGEMLPIVDRPLIQYAVDEALAAGISELIFVTHRSKRAIEDYFDRAVEVERALESKGQHGQLAELRGLAPDHLHIVYARQSAPLGLGHAIHCARHLIGNEPFAVILPADLIDSDPPVLSQLLERYQDCGGSLVAVQPVRREKASQFGLLQTDSIVAPLARVTGIGEKPPAATRLAQAVVGRYIFSPRILDCLDCPPSGTNDEVQLTDGIARLLALEPVFACQVRGTRYDCGSKLGFLDATLAYACRHPELGQEFRAIVAALARQWQPPRRSPPGKRHGLVVSSSGRRHESTDSVPLAQLAAGGSVEEH
jgi:UTP--glucose-1-phosphate uridylyltransferase